MSLSLAKNVIVAGADNRPHMLDNTQYSSWASRILLYIRGKENGKLLVDSILNGPFKYGTVTVPRTLTTRATVKDRIYDELIDAEKIRKGCDIKATNIVLQGLPQDIYNLERELKLYDEFDMFTSVPGETINTLIVPSFLPIDDPIASLNKAMDFISTAFTSRYPPTNNQLKTSSNLRNQETIQDGRVTVRQRLFATTTVKRKATWQDSVPNLKGLGSQEIPTLIAFQTDDLDAFDSDCDETPSASAILMAKLSSYDSDILSEYSERPDFNNNPDIDITSDMSNQVAKCNEVDKENKIINESLTTKLEKYKEQIKLFKERQKLDLNDREKYINVQLQKVIVDKNAKVTNFENQIHSLKQLNETVQSHKTLSTTVDVLKMKSKAKEDKYLDEFIEFEKQKKALDNVIYKMGQSMQTMHMLTKPQASYDESHKTTLGYQNPLYLSQAQRKLPALYCENKVNILPIDYVALNKLSEHFVKHFVLQKQLFAEQAFWLLISKPVSETPPVQPEPVLKEIPHELCTISLVKDSFNKMRNHVNDFENVVTVRTKVTGQNEGLHKEITDMKEVFTQMETEVAKCSVERKTFEIKEKELLLENERLLELLMTQDLVHTTVNSLAKIIDYQSIEKSFLDEYSECVKLKVELSKKNDIVEKAVYDELSKRCTIMENRSVSSTSANGSKSLGNIKKNMIPRPTSINKKNKVEDHLGSVKPSLNKKNLVSKPVCDANVKHSVLNVNSELICATCNKCMFDAIHDLCVIDYVNDVNVSVKSKSLKSKKKKAWKPTVIMEYLVKISKKARILELKRRNIKITVLTSYTSYPSRKIRRICACTSQKTTKEQDQYANSSYLGLRKKYRLSLKNDMPPRDK
ncbi:hypothetical protein Tco_0221272 [Tanacetum coccineum]